LKNWADISWSPAVVSANLKIAEGAFILKIPRTFDFRAGQVVALGTSSTMAPRLYSIASGEQDPEVEILFTGKNDGALTPILSQLQAGDTLMVSPPFGKFTGIEPRSVLIAAGTGIAPFMSVLRSGKAPGATLIHGASYPNYFYFGSYLSETLGSDYLRCCSRVAGGDWFHGRVTAFVEQWKSLDPGRKFYLCGSAEMVVNTRDVLISKGVPFKHIDAEIFF
jgi:ferredoxin/flavodoxin---NADP+ reductase